MSENLMNYISKYEENFEEFPSIPLVWGRSENEVIEIINECISKKQDVYELGYIETDIDTDY